MTVTAIIIQRDEGGVALALLMMMVNSEQLIGTRGDTARHTKYVRTPRQSV